FGSQGVFDLLHSPAGSYLHNWSLMSIPHEFAHTMQSKATKKTRAIDEGGAAAWSHIVGPQVFAGHQYRNPPYTNYASFVNQVKRKGLDWILHKQFEAAKGGFAEALKPD